MKKFKLFVDIIKEEQWLNTMLQKGWLCVKVNSLGLYTFEKTDNIYQIIRIDFQTNQNKTAFIDYKQLYLDFGWHHLKGNRFTGLHYWRKEKNGQDELFSDTESKIASLKKVANYTSASAITFLAFTVILYANNSTPSFFNITDAYFTPGLWDKTGWKFWFSFLFETPFALGRFLGPWFVIITGTMYLLVYARYKKAVKNLSL
ncbi:MAG: DUF2812 domain-containing protein [Lysinibacillus sp.]